MSTPDHLNHLECATCGDFATHLYGCYDPTSGLVSSATGPGCVAPSCDECDGAEWDPDLVPLVVFRLPLPDSTAPEYTAFFYGQQIGPDAEAYLDWVQALPEVQS